MEMLIPACEIDPELSQTMLPKAERSYTEIWLQSLSQAPERKKLEPLEPGLPLPQIILSLRGIADSVFAQRMAQAGELLHQIMPRRQ